MKKFIYHHLGLGDHLVCNGLVRELTKNKTNKYYLFSYSHNRVTVEFMYRDIDNLEIIGVENDNEVSRFLQDNNVEDMDVHVAGVMYKSNWFPDSKSFEESFYLQNNFNLSAKWDSFKIDRDPQRENDLKTKLNVPKDSEYIFIHDDDRFKIDESKIQSKLIKIRPEREMTDNIFDYCSILENAKEVHVIESSFCFILDLLGLNNYVFVHRYARWQNDFGLPEYKNILKIID